MSTISVPEFSGEPGDEVQPVDFLKKFRLYTQAFSITDESVKIEAFGDHLKTGSAAETWFNSQALGTKKVTTWAALEQAFNTRFPGLEKAKKTNIDYQHELLALRLEIGELGKLVKYGGVEVWSHTAFAEKVYSLAVLAGIENGPSHIFSVRDKLPEVLREKVSENQTDWRTFCNAIKNIDLSYIKECVRKYEQEKQKDDKLNTRLQKLERFPSTPMTPVSKMAAQMNRTTITTPSRTTTSTNPFNATTGGTGNLFANKSTSAEKDQLRARIAAYPLQPDTPEGLVAWHQQLTAWRAEFPSLSKPTVASGFPLRPGTSPVCSGECWKCGKMGHSKNDCQDLRPVNEFERSFHSLCSTVLGRNRSLPQVNHIADTSADDDLGWVGDSVLNEQGKEQGSPE